MATLSKEELLEEVKRLNEREDYKMVIDLLTDEVLKRHNDAALYAEKAQACYREKQYKQSNAAADAALVIDGNNAKAWHYKGNWFYNQGKKDEAIEAYKKAIGIDPKFAKPYNGLGNVYRALKKYIDAEAVYKMAIELDKNSEIAIYNLALLNYEWERYVGALENFRRYVEVTKINDDQYYIYAQNKIDELSKLLQAPTKIVDAAVPETQMKLDLPNDTATTDTPDNEHRNKIKEIIVRIKKVLAYRGDPTTNTAGSEQGGQMYVTHYTTFEAAKALILKKSPLRLSEGAFLNDTSEGKALFSFLSADNGLIKEPDPTDVERFKSRYFIGSYVPGSLHDDLPLWRTYAKHDNLDAKGCSITYDCRELIESIKEKLKGDGTDDYTFYRVAYRKGREATAQFRIPNGNGEPDGPLNKELNDLLTLLKAEVITYLSVDDRSTKDVRTNYIRKHLSEIAYFFKNDLYETEREIRIVLKGDDFAKNIGEKPQPEEGELAETTQKRQIETLPKVYIELVEIVPLLKRLTLGPKMDKKEEWASTFYYYLKNERPNKDSGGKEPPEVEVYISHLPFK